MPISRANLARYPADWRAIRARIQARAGDRCEWCGVPNLQWVVRRKDDHRQWQACATQEGAWLVRKVLIFAMIHVAAPVRIVCTTAHVHDHDPANCADDNLAFLCQKCHLTHDAKLHAANAARTRAARRQAGPSLFGGDDAA